jgi:hypothetical protein
MGSVGQRAKDMGWIEYPDRSGSWGIIRPDGNFEQKSGRTKEMEANVGAEKITSATTDEKSSYLSAHRILMRRSDGERSSAESWTA